MDYAFATDILDLILERGSHTGSSISTAHPSTVIMAKYLGNQDLISEYQIKWWGADWMLIFNVMKSPYHSITETIKTFLLSNRSGLTIHGSDRFFEDLIMLKLSL